MVYKATWKQIEVVLKSLYNSNNMNIEFLKEVSENIKLYKFILFCIDIFYYLLSIGGIF